MIMEVPKSYRMLGFKTTPMTGSEIVEIVSQCASRGRRTVIASLNVHGMYIGLVDRTFRALHEDHRTLVHIDGIPLIWIGRLLGIPIRGEHRTAVLDWILPLMQNAAARGLRVYYLGSTAAVVQAGITRLKEIVPALEIAGHDGYFDANPESSENRKIVDEINSYATDILVVGMGMGRQEKWIWENLDDLRATCVLTTGAYLEFISGTVPTPPRWLGRAGLEWLFRLATSPRRFAWRYLVEPWLVAWLLIKQKRHATTRGRYEG